MIVDTLSNTTLYRNLSPRSAQAFEYLRNTDFQHLTPGVFEITGREVHAIVQEYTTMARAQGAWEAHRRYIELQYVLSGTEQIGYTHLGRLTPGRYDEARDLLPLAGAEAGAFSRAAPAISCSCFPKTPTCRASPSRSPA